MIRKAPLTHSLLNFTFGGFKGFFQIKTSSSNDALKSLKVYGSSPRPLHAFFPLLLRKAFVELMVERKARQTCFKYFAKPKIEPNRLNKSYNHDREVHVCGRVVDGMGEMKYSMYDLSLLIIFRHG